jgi:hypothetical protein
VNNPAPTAIFHLRDKGPGKAHATREIQLENSSSCRLQITTSAQAIANGRAIAAPRPLLPPRRGESIAMHSIMGVRVTKCAPKQGQNCPVTKAPTQPGSGEVEQRLLLRAAAVGIRSREV